jgi:hypothetical protein
VEEEMGKWEEGEMLIPLSLPGSAEEEGEKLRSSRVRVALEVEAEIM